jgi:hypothetical protein
LIKLAGYPLKQVESQICPSVHDDERVPSQRLDGENIDKVEWQSFAFGGHHHLV